MLLYAMLLVCSILAGVMVYRHDMYDREPLYMLIIATALGGGGMWCAGQVQVIVLSAMGNTAALDWNTWLSAMAGLTEEAAKFLMVLLIACVFRRQFNDPMDGIIYGSFVGLGAAIDESVSLFGWPRSSMVMPAQEPVRLLGHLVMGGIGGYGVGLAFIERRRWVVPLGLTFIVAFAVHFLWDVTAFSAADAKRMLPWHKGAAITIMAFGLVVYWYLVKLASRLSQKRFAPKDAPD